MVAFLASLIITGTMIAIVIVVARRRPPGSPMTWGQAVIAATFSFAIMLMMYGVVPNEWLQWFGNELGWRSDSFGIPTPFGRLFVDGISFGGRGRILISAQVIGDLGVVVIYGGFFVGQIAGWLWWQKRGRRTTRVATVETSAFGRPVVTKA